MYFSTTECIKIPRLNIEWYPKDGSFLPKCVGVDWCYIYVFVCARCWSDKMNYNSYVSPLLASRRQKCTSVGIPDSVCSGWKLHVYTYTAVCAVHTCLSLSHTHTHTHLARTNYSFQPIMHACVCVCVCVCVF